MIMKFSLNEFYENYLIKRILKYHKKLIINVLIFSSPCPLQEWTVFKPLLCHPCIKRLNIAYMFKKQCVQSAGVLTNYIELVKESQKKAESQSAVVQNATGTYMLLPNQKYVKILVSGNSSGPAAPVPPNTFQNVFLNVIPATTISPVGITPVVEPVVTDPLQSKDTNQNVFLSLNNTFQKFIPVAPSPAPPSPPVEIKKVDRPPLIKPAPNAEMNQLFTAVKSEEVSVEIDPTIFGLGDDGCDSNEDDNNDYDEVISQAKITLKDFKPNGERVQNGKDDQKYYVPILPKTQQDDFVTSGQHFLFSTSNNPKAFICESCQKSFTTKKLLRMHFNQFHLGKLPFKCDFCYTDFLTRAEYESCSKGHMQEAEMNKSITLQDLANESPHQTEPEAQVQPAENGKFVCNICTCVFNSSSGLLRHKVRKHNHKNKKKYFIKGMKNARCDICNRDFSTTSYLQLHKKLHLRDDFGYKYKVFGKSKYGETDGEDKKEDEDNDERPNISSIEVTPDISMEDNRSMDEEEDNNPDEAIDPLADDKMEVGEEEHSDDHISNHDDNSNADGNSSQDNSIDEDTDEATSEKN